MASPTTYLFVPGDRPERFDKALASGAGTVIIDLEDAVPPDLKTAARWNVKQWLDNSETPVVIRVNACDTPWFADDLALCASPGVAAIMLPKAEKPNDLATCARAAPHVRLLPLIETAAGFDALRSLAKAPSVERFVFGSIDFQLDLGITGEGEELLYFRSQLVLASRLGGLAAPVDGVTTEIRDTDIVLADAARARRLGFGAKLCIHPAQVAPVKRAFEPSVVETEWAKRVLDASARADGAAATVDGKMIDRPVVLRARAILEQASSS